MYFVRMSYETHDCAGSAGVNGPDRAISAATVHHSHAPRTLRFRSFL
jgi:hypothetical protein